MDYSKAAPLNNKLLQLVDWRISVKDDGLAVIRFEGVTGSPLIIKQEHAQLFLEAYECADLVPELNKMTFVVQALVAQCEDLKVKYHEEQVNRRKLHNQVQEAKGVLNPML
ncbi:hypothetical protein LguiA_035835 [Lonicera macranthoides]